MLKPLVIIVIIFLNFNELIRAQTCGPNCPACSGTTEGSLLLPNTFSLQGLIIPAGDEEFGITNFRYGVFDWLEAGIGYTFKSQKVIWNARMQFVQQNEDNWKPNAFIGTGQGI